MANVLLGVTGSVAAIRTPELYAELKGAGNQVKVVATHAALYFLDPVALDPIEPDTVGRIGNPSPDTVGRIGNPSHMPRRNSEVVILDEDEWPGRFTGR